MQRRTHPALHKPEVGFLGSLGLAVWLMSVCCAVRCVVQHYTHKVEVDFLVFYIWFLGLSFFGSVAEANDAMLLCCGCCCCCCCCVDTGMSISDATGGVGISG